jgi:hypothetical protein
MKRDITRTSLIKEIGSSFPEGKGVEIGTFKGEFSNEIMKNWNGTLYMVDVWNAIEEGYEDASNHGRFDIDIYGEAIKNIKGYEDRAIMIRAKSEIASNLFQDESLDFVYIDANHAYDYVVQDIKLWYPKVKPGGFVMGHDYIDLDWYGDPNFDKNKKDKHIWSGDVYHGVFGVNPAVDEFCERNEYKRSLTTEWFGTWYFQKRS